MTFFRARRENGFQMVRRLLKLDALIREHDLVITGEGCLDATSLLGKAPAQLGELARALDRPAWALCGRASLPVSKAPFDRVAALRQEGDPELALASISPEEHGRRLERLAYEMALSYRASPQSR